MEIPRADRAGTSTDLRDMVDAQHRVCESLRNTLKSLPPSETKKRQALAQELQWSEATYQRLERWLADSGEHGSEAAVDAAPPTRRRPLLTEIGILAAASLLVLHTYSGPRSAFATTTLALAVYLVFNACRVEDDAATAGRKRAQLRPRLAFLYLCHWSVDLLALWLAGDSITEHAIKIAKGMAKAPFALCVLYSSLLAMTGAEGNCDALHRFTIGFIITAQGVLGLRAFVVWRELLTDPEWRGAPATNYAYASAASQVLLPLVAFFCGHLYTASRYRSPPL